MHRTTALLLWMGLWMPLSGAAYFCVLLLNLSVGWSIGVSLAIGAGLAWWLRTMMRINASPTLSKRAGLLLLAGITGLAVACAFLARRYGDWDAALIWNLHARHLAAGEGWNRFYEPGASGNAAYPLGLPSTTALLWRALGTQSQTVPFILALLPTMAVPIVIFLESARTKIWLGAAVLAAFGLHRYYLALGLDQYADIQLAWLWLLAAVCMNRATVFSQRNLWTVAGLLLGAMMWTKWDGVLLACCLVAVYARILFRQPRTFLLILLGAAPFLLTIALFVQTGPPRAPLLTDFGGVATRVMDGERYKMIASAFAHEAVGRHWMLSALLLATPLLWRRRRVSGAAKRLYAAVVLAILGFAAVYLLLVSTDLEWNLTFSLPRLLLQVYPLAVFAAALAVSSRQRSRTLQ